MMTPPRALEHKSSIKRTLRQLRAQSEELYIFMYNCERGGLFDGISNKEVAEKMGLSQSAFSKKKRKLLEFVESMEPEQRLEKKFK